MISTTSLFMLSKNWFKAYRFTESLGIRMPGIPSISEQSRSYIDRRAMELTLGALKNEYEGRPGERFFLKCFEVHNLVYNTLWDALIPCYYTMGWVSCSGERLFFHNELDLTNWAKDGLPDMNNVSLHCWITFPSGEIVDATISSVLAIRNNSAESIGEIIWGQSEELKHIKYTPTFIGCEASKAIGLAR